jgi:hypothetical protein
MVPQCGTVSTIPSECSIPLLCVTLEQWCDDDRLDLPQVKTDTATSRVFELANDNALPPSGSLPSLHRTPQCFISDPQHWIWPPSIARWNMSFAMLIGRPRTAHIQSVWPAACLVTQLTNVILSSISASLGLWPHITRISFARFKPHTKNFHGPLENAPLTLPR